MEIFHGGYFDKQLDGSKKYKVPRFNKTGGKIYLDGLDPDKISWVEMNNIAYALGYRELPISYHFKVPGSPANVGLIEIKSDGDAIEMVKMIPQKKKKQISVYIIGGGRRKYAEALADFQKDVAPNFENPLNKLSALEKQRAHFEANMFASQLYDVIDVVPLSQEIVIEVPNEDGPSQGIFAGLDDIVVDLDIGEKRRQSGGHSGKEAEKTAKTVKHSGKRSWPLGYKDQLSQELENIRQKEKESIFNYRIFHYNKLTD